MIRVKRIDHVVLRTTRMEAMCAFYRDALGCQVERTMAEIGLVQLRAGDSLIDLVDVDGELGRMGGPAPSGTGNNMDHYCLQVSGGTQEEVQAWLRARGIDGGEWETRYGALGYGPSVYIRDPEGNTVELRFEAEAPQA